MAKTMTTRVHHLAKQLGVPSKEIVRKCQEEDIPNVTNHMSAVSLGLAETIREWYGEGGAAATTTAVEAAAPVDVTKARARAKKKPARKPESKKSEEAKTSETGRKKSPAKDNGQTAEPPAEQPPTTTETAPAAEPEQSPQSPSQPTPSVEPETAPAAEAGAEPQGEAAAEEKSSEQETQDPSEPKSGPQVNVPRKPEEVAPAGPMLEQPTKVKLSGPRVIRVEKPEEVRTPQPRGQRKPGGGGEAIGRGGPRAGRGVGHAGAEGPAPEGRGGGGGGGRGGTSRRNKRRSASAREQPKTGRGQQQSDQNFNWREQDLLERENRLSRSGGFFKAHRRDNLKRAGGGGQANRPQTAAQAGGVVEVDEPVTIKDLSAATGVKANDILRKLFLSGHRVTINSTIDADTAVELMLEYDIELKVEEQKSAEEQIVEQFEQREMVDERPRTPVVTILGHVDHGKTSLLDSIRKTKVAEGEAGGITQATSAFTVPVRTGEKDRTVTFIDTPGHEAFTEMRSRGARVTDVIILVVAADDGVMPQTVESINHAKAAGVPIIVALNKVDKPEATDSNIQRILGQLAEHELNPVEWGGQTEVVRTSAINEDGVADVLEMVDFQADLLELKADFGGPAQGTVLESSMQEGRGPVANILIQQGNLQKGDFIVVGRAYGRVRDIINDRGKRIESAGPSTPVAISGIDEVPDAGDAFYVVRTLKDAEAAAEERREQDRQRDLVREKVTLDNIFDKLSESKKKELPLIIKADVQGSVDTLKATLSKIANEDVAVAVKHAAVGGVNESDVLLAETTGAIVLGFNVTAPGKVRKRAEERGVDIRFYDVIYDVSDDVKRAAEGLLDPEHRLEVIGHAEVRDVFKITRVGMVAGCYVTDGVVERNAQIRVTRGDIVVEKDRRLEQLKRFKDDAKEVRAGQECGMKIEGYNDIKVGDVLECYKTQEVRRTL